MVQIIIWMLAAFQKSRERVKGLGKRQMKEQSKSTRVSYHAIANFVKARQDCKYGGEQ